MRVVLTRYYVEQALELTREVNDVLAKKITALETRPFANKRIHHRNLHIFRIRFTDRRKEKRLMYLVENDTVIVLCILDRDKECKDIEKYL